MNWWLPNNFKQKRTNLEKRAQIFKILRQFFDSQDFTEVHTPALQVCPVMDAHIHAFKTMRLGIDCKPAQEMYLHTSPEFDMKKLLAAGMERIYQICPVYRNAEGSSRHSPEFMILEWYRMGADYHVLMEDCALILRSIAQELGITHYSYKGINCDPFGVVERLSLIDAFQRYAYIDLCACLDDRDILAGAARKIGIRVIDDDKWDDIFHAIMAAKIEPFLGNDVPTILYDYPISMAALSRPKTDDPRFAERFELYACGVELANAFSELTDAQEQRSRYAQEMEIKQALYGETYPPDEEFFQALEYMKDCAGIALGVDRLIMLATGAENINDVLWAPVAMKDDFIK